MKRSACACVYALALAALPSRAVTVTIDTATAYQTIEGFGFFGPMLTWWSSSNASAFYSDAWLDMIVNNLGITIWRNEYYSEESNQDANWAKQRPMVVALKAKADASGVPLKFIYSVWSPPSRWKSNTSLKNGGTLLPEYYDEFGQWLVDGITNYANAGIQLYALSPQNEPLFAQYYNSCVYSIPQYRDMIKVAGPIVHAAYPNVKIFGPEHMLFGVARDWDWSNLDPSQATLTDTASRRHLDIWACHGYGADGATPTPTSEEAQYWQKARQRIGPFGKPMWMTETSGYGSTWNDAIEYLLSVHAALYYGRVNGWVHWYGADDLVTTSALTKKGYAAKHYYRYVRPGAQAVSAAVQSDAELFVTAYKHASDRTLAIVLINTGTSAKTIAFSGSALPASFRMYRTTSSENCVDAGETATGSVSLPARSVVTLYHAEPSGVRPGRRGAGLPASAPPVPGRGRLHRLDGSVHGSRSAPPGVYVAPGTTERKLVALDRAGALR